MRTIKFRGKRLDGEWAYGYYAESDEYGDNGGCEHNYRETITTLYYIVDRNGKPELVLPESVGQWTGLVDKNGVEIYEGDVVKAENTQNIGEIKYMHEHGSFLVYSHDEKGAYYEHLDIGLCEKYFEVKGNIIDTPELLEV